jgi:NAD(P)-dependent dehydrogenase (short-subunit alcohol dehydrogenase family)
VGLAKSISKEVAPLGITVNTVAPGWIGTENMYHYLETKVGVTPDKVDEWLGDDIPARRIGTPAECASLIAYLCSQQAAYLTGEYIVVDGGVQKSVT